MKICKVCNVPMVNVMSFSRDKQEKFYRCQKCYNETRHQKIKDSELDFEEVLHKEYQKRR